MLFEDAQETPYLRRRLSDELEREADRRERNDIRAQLRQHTSRGNLDAVRVLGIPDPRFRESSSQAVFATASPSPLVSSIRDAEYTSKPPPAASVEKIIFLRVIPMPSIRLTARNTISSIRD